MQRIGSARPPADSNPPQKAGSQLVTPKSGSQLTKSGSQLVTKAGSQLTKPKVGSQVVKPGSQLKTVAAVPKKVHICLHFISFCV
jgi:hypothetical protein